MILVNVYAGNSELALRTLKKKMQRELVFRSMRLSRCYEPPSVKRLRRKEEAMRRRHKNIKRLRMEEE